jgi:hypothetical protein
MLKKWRKSSLRQVVNQKLTYIDSNKEKEIWYLFQAVKNNFSLGPLSNFISSFKIV